MGDKLNSKAQEHEQVGQSQRPRFVRVSVFATVILLGLMALALGIILDTRLGVMEMTNEQVWQALTVDDGSRERVVIWELRLPRSLVAALVGVNLTLAGILMQALTRNPLAAPSITGVTSGGALAIVLAAALYPSHPLRLTPFIAFAGALAGGAIVFTLVMRRGITPVRLALAGFATASLLSAVSTGVLLLRSSTAGTVFFWLAGGVAGRGWQHVHLILPWTLVGGLASLILTRQLDILLLGEDVARGLGLRMALLRGVLIGLAVILAGSSVAVAGPIGFVGLICPHLARFLISVEHRYVLGVGAVLGSNLVVWADIVARHIRKPFEMPIGIIIAILGGPFFLYLARKSR